VLQGQHAPPRPQLAAAPGRSPEGGSGAAAGGGGFRGSTGRPPHVSTLSTASAPRSRQRAGELLLSRPGLGAGDCGLRGHEEAAKSAWLKQHIV
jgi:hypothetical protein